MAGLIRFLHQGVLAREERVLNRVEWFNSLNLSFEMQVGSTYEQGIEDYEDLVRSHLFYYSPLEKNKD